MLARACVESGAALREPFEQPSPIVFEEAVRDLQNRTLDRLDGDFAKLVYLASTRDYNTGRYAHDGLSFRFSEPVAERVLAAAHRENPRWLNFDGRYRRWCLVEAKVARLPPAELGFAGQVWIYRLAGVQI